ncbi:hypothetical protein [uncultured Helicobacter sp.]|uniref:hypothetical protein n=1 Tax=uncultured Helicobacter sp. TaxID=175537 RepID=UPI002605F4BE|nr:hypothetical protein [uncultured Helicobacter sp.]
MDWNFDSIGSLVDKGVNIYNSYSSNQTANDIARQQANANWHATETQNKINLSNAKLMLIGGVILAIGTGLFIFNRK